MKVIEEHDFVKLAPSASSASDSHVRSGGVIAHQGIDSDVSFCEVRRSDQVGGTYGHGHGQEHEQFINVAESLTCASVAIESDPTLTTETILTTTTDDNCSEN